MVNMAKPLAFSRTLRGMTYWKLLVSPTPKTSKRSTHAVEPIVAAIDERVDWLGKE